MASSVSPALTMRTAVLAVGELWHHRIRLAYSSRAMQPRRQRVHRSRRHTAFLQRCMNVQNHRDEARRALQSPRRAGAAKIQHPSSLATIPKIFLWFVRFLPISRDTHTGRGGGGPCIGTPMKTYNPSAASHVRFSAVARPHLIGPASHALRTVWIE